MFYCKYTISFTIYQTYCFLVKPTLQFSTSILHNTDVKTMSGDDKICLNVDYNEILKAQNDSSVLIIDVREKEEIDETGKLPGSIHIPSMFQYRQNHALEY